jgi:myo-inositol-1(or 4)-monophosphatase
VPLQDLESLAITAGRAAAAGAHLLRNLWGNPEGIEQKSRFDFVTQADRASQEAVLAVIRKEQPGQAILAEESAGDYSEARNQPGILWVVDPLDGTTNFIHGFPHVAVSVAALLDGRPVVGVIRDVTRDEEFSAVAGQGAWLDGHPLTVSEPPQRSHSLLLTGFPFRHKEILDSYLALFSELFQSVAGMRRAGSACLDLAYLAAGRAQGFWELGLKPWDLAAGLLLISEAGGVVSDFHGGDQALWRGDICAATPDLHPWLQEACARHFPRI